jgi:formiminotetrahydrofolate cyclodeaminase
MQEKTIEQFTDELSSKAHIPGGGAVAALSGACAASLIAMVLNLTIGKKGFEEHDEKLKPVLDEAIRLRDDMLGGMKRDADAFDSLMACYKLPKETKEEKIERKKTMQAAFKAAAGEPLATMKKARAMLDSIGELIPITNPNLVSDLGLAAINAVACSKGALLNVFINLPSIKDEDFVKRAEADIETTQDNIDEVLQDILDDVYSVIRGDK